MSDRKPGDDDDSILPLPELEPLPPLDDDEPEPDPYEAPLAGGDDAAPLGDDDGDGDGNLDDFRDVLGDYEDGAAEDDIDLAGDALGAEDLEEEEGGWDPAATAPLSLDDAWFEDEDVGAAGDDDGGAEGPLVEAESFFPEPPAEMDVQRLGPEEGRVAAAAFVGGALVAVGDGMYRLGADGLLHRGDDGDDIDATSCVAADGALYIGTARGEVLGTRGFGAGFRRLGAWGAADGGEARGVRVVGIGDGPGVRLFAIADGGALRLSDDRGDTWSGPVTDRPVIAAAEVRGEGLLLALVRGQDGTAVLLRGDGRRDAWIELPLPPPLAALAAESSCVLAAAGGIVAIAAARPGKPLWISRDGGREFREAPAVAFVTALAVDPDEPGWIAAATYRPESDSGSIRLSDDAGATWRVVLVTGRAVDPDEAPRGGRITALDVRADDRPRIHGVVDGELVSLTLPRRDASQ